MKYRYARRKKNVLLEYKAMILRKFWEKKSEIGCYCKIEFYFISIQQLFIVYLLNKKQKYAKWCIRLTVPIPTKSIY